MVVAGFVETMVGAGVVVCFVAVTFTAVAVFGVVAAGAVVETVELVMVEVGSRVDVAAPRTVPERVPRATVVDSAEVEAEIEIEASCDWAASFAAAAVVVEWFWALVMDETNASKPTPAKKMNIAATMAPKKANIFSPDFFCIIANR